MALTDTNTPGSPTTEGNATEPGYLTFANTVAAVGGAIIIGLTLWKWWKTGEV